MQDEEKKWVAAQITVYERAIEIAERLNNKEKLQEYKEMLEKLKSSLQN